MVRPVGVGADHCPGCVTRHSTQYHCGKMGILLVMPECLTLALPTTPFVTRDLLEQNTGWNNTGDKHGVCVQWAADVWNCLHWPARLPLASLHTDRRLDGCCSDVSMVAVWVPSFCGGLGLWKRALSWKYTQLYVAFFLSFFFFFFGELMICFFDISVFDEFCIYILGVPFRSKLLRTFYWTQTLPSSTGENKQALTDYCCQFTWSISYSIALCELHVLEIWLSFFSFTGKHAEKAQDVWEVS